ncbi:cupin domain-containing protein [Fimbriimonas ginsengisoli]|uniref:Pectin degradation protein kdgF n=1 Tax=Fimbriimonas ginsengisoli Gsoil 348 TaxID=661478 RepID=A0A068NX68_FIMGI|nr:cupin domain-containing protein [Fimbriimonas ginsengisoli]AIE86219.1 pectin degradation protein kdgF [Fimbriimonas ginsengisoli Gsoil 348]
MDATLFRWNEVAEDNPIPLLTRRTVKGERMMAARVRLEPGCVVAEHRHESEQIAVVLSGHVRWGLGEKGTPGFRYQEMRGGEVMVLPSNFPHSLEVYEAAEIIDFLTPIGPMGVDSQKS